MTAQIIPFPAKAIYRRLPWKVSAIVMLRKEQLQVAPLMPEELRARRAADWQAMRVWVRAQQLK